MRFRFLRCTLAAPLLARIAGAQEALPAPPPPPPPPPQAQPASPPGAQPTPGAMPPPGTPVPYGPYTPYPPYPTYGYPSYPYAYPPPPPAAEPPRSRWYGWQTLITDGGALLLVSAGGNGNSAPIVGVGVADYFLGAPIVHFAHGHVGKGFGSLAMRAGPWIVFGLIAANTRCNFFDGGNRDSGCSAIVDGAVFAILSVPAAIAIDSAVLARETVVPEKSVSWTPKLDLRRDRATVGVAAQF